MRLSFSINIPPQIFKIKSFPVAECFNLNPQPKEPQLIGVIAVISDNVK